MMEDRGTFGNYIKMLKFGEATGGALAVMHPKSRILNLMKSMEVVPLM